MQSLSARIASFKAPARRGKNALPSWKISPSTHPKLTPENLAEAGFFFNPSIEEPDNCQCFSCGLQLGGWDEDDDPFVEQCKRFDCAWGEMVCAPKVARDKDEISMTVPDAALLPGSSTSTETRLRTFFSPSDENLWPHPAEKSWKPSKEKVAAAGFVYHEIPDYVICPYCQYSVGDWEAKDDPMLVHKSKKPSCPFFTITLDPPAASLKASTRSAPKPRAIRAKRTNTATNPAAPPSQAESVVGEDDGADFVIEPVKKGRRAAAKPASTAKGRGKKVAESDVAESVMEEAEEDVETLSVVVVEAEKPKRRGRQAKKVESEPAPKPEVQSVLADVQEVPEPAKKERKPRATKASKKAEAEARAEAEAILNQEEAVMEAESAVVPEIIPDVQGPTPISKPSKASKAGRASKATVPSIAIPSVPVPLPKSAPSVPPSPAPVSQSSRPIKSIRAAKLEKSLAAAAASGSSQTSEPRPSSSSSRTGPPSRPTSGKASNPTSVATSSSKPLPPTPRDTPRSLQPLNQLAQYANIPPTSPLTSDQDQSRAMLDAALDQAAQSARQVMVDFTSPRAGAVGAASPTGREEDAWMREPLTAEERKMTIEQLVRRQLEKRAQVMETEGEAMIRKWKEDAMVVRAQIKAALQV